MKKLSTYLIIAATILQTNVDVQAQTAKKSFPAGKGPEDFPELQFTKIPGAPGLSMPKLIMGDARPVMSEGMGWASPAFFDVDNDGKKDLLLGEFSSRLEDRGITAGNFVRIYKNEGTETAPRFSDIYNYLYPIEDESTGTPLSVYSWCCLGFTPRFVDLDNDGYQDIATGQYNPGIVTWFRGSEEGFHRGQELPQFGDPRVGSKQRDNSIPRTNHLSWEYWNYSSVAFGDFDGKGLSDMIIGGSALRISKNIGTKTEPGFGRRELLLDTHGNPLVVGKYYEKYKNEAGEPYYGGSMVPTVADWDQDGVPDLLVTDNFVQSGSPVITFFRAVKTAEGLRFEKGVPLFTVTKGEKAFPGSWPHVCVADWNNDGINDLIIGTSVATIAGKFNHELSWTWENESGIIKKYSAYYSAEMTRTITTQMRQADSIQAILNLSDAEMQKGNYFYRASLFKHFYGKEAYKKLAHQGYVYVMLGNRKN
jgi:hypothetical protein